MSASTIPVIIDCDTGIDDANALVLACASPRLNILAVTTSAGNTVIEAVTQNTLNVLHLLGRDDIPVGRGAARPLLGAPLSAEHVHGANGLGGYQFARDVSDALSPLPAGALMAHILEAHTEPVTLIALGRATNIAALLALRPDLRAKIEKIVFMGTADQHSLVRTANVRGDPEAFQICLDSGLPVYGVGRLLALRHAYLTQNELEEIGRIGTKVSGFVYQTLSAYSDHQLVDGKNTIPMFDEATVAFTIDPGLFTYQKYFCEVDCGHGWRRGLTYIDFDGTLKKPEVEKNLYYVESADRAGFAKLMLDAVRFYG